MKYIYNNVKLLRSKLLQPEPGQHLISRTRLVKRLVEPQDTRLFLLVAPAGYGKTMVALQTLLSLPQSARAWYNLDSSDARPERFLAYLITAIAETNSLVRSSGLVDRLGRGSEPTETVDDLCYILQEYRGPNCWLVLDNCEELSGSKEIWRMVEKISANGAGRLKFIITSRTKPPIKAQRSIQNNETLLLDEYDLSFTLVEFADVLSAGSNLEVSESDMQQLWKMTSGWCMGTAFIASKLRSQSGPHTYEALTGFLNQSKSLATYIEEEYFSELSETFADGILRCSVLDTLTSQDCAVLLGNLKKTDEFLRDLRISAIPHSVLANDGDIRLHPLVKRIARRLLKTRLPVSEVSHLYSAASRNYKDRGDSPKAIELLLESENFDAAIELINEYVGQTLFEYEPGESESWLGKFPDRFKDHPLYIKMRAMYLNSRGDGKEVVNYLEHRLDPAMYPDQSLFVFLWQINWRAKLLATQWNSVQTPIYSAVMSEWKTLIQPIKINDWSLLAATEYNLGHAALLTGDTEVSLRHLTKAAELLDRESTVSTRLVIDRAHYLTSKAICVRRMGNCTESIRILKEVLAEFDKHGLLVPQIRVLIVLAASFVDQGRYFECLETLNTCEDVISRCDVDNASARVHIGGSRGEALLNIGDTTMAMRHMQSAYELADRYGIGLKNDLWYYLRFCALIQNPKEREPSGDERHSCDTPLSPLLDAYRTLVNRDQGLVKKTLAGFLNYQHSVPPTGIVAFEFYRAYWADRENRPRNCRGHIRKGLEALQKNEINHYQWKNSILTSFVVAKAVRFNILPTTAAKLATGERHIDLSDAFERELKDGKLAPAEQLRLLTTAEEMKIRGLRSVVERSYSKSSIPKVRELSNRYLKMEKTISLPPLTINTFGRFSVMSQGRTISFGRIMPRRILQILLINHPKPVHKSVLIEALWPEISDAQGESYLHPRISELRQSLDPRHQSYGDSYVDCKSNYYSLTLPDGSLVDFVEFSRTIDKVGSGTKDIDNIKKHASDVRKALSLCQGEFLPDERYEAFASEHRLWLITQFLRLSLGYSKYLLSSHKIYDAITAVDRGLEFDPLWQDGVMMMMEARVKNGELYKALRLYRDYEKRIQRELNLPPDEELKSYFESLVGPQEE